MQRFHTALHVWFISDIPLCQDKSTDQMRVIGEQPSTNWECYICRVSNLRNSLIIFALMSRDGEHHINQPDN